MNITNSPRTSRITLIVGLVIVAISLTFSTISVMTVLSAPMAAPLAAPVTVTVPNQVGFEGFLADASGYPVADGVYSLTFAVYSTTTGTTPLWSEVQTPTQVTQGLYAVTLGSVTSLPANLFSGNRWIGVKVGASTEITPRTKVASVPFALSAAQAIAASDADLLDGQEGTYYQRRVSGLCAAGSTVQGVNADGTVICQVDAPLNRAMAPSSNTTTTVDSSAASVGGHTSITIGADGLPVVSYYDDTNTNLKVLHCGNAVCSSGNISTTVDSTGAVGLYTSITLGADGLPVISYYDDTNDDLKVLHCGNTACSSSNTATTVDSGGSNNVGGEFSPVITIGVDGLPVVAYNDTTNGDLKVLHCGNTVCSSGNISTTVDATNAVGQRTSITIGADGLPVISYQDYTNFDLKVLHCGNAACTSGNTATTVDSTGTIAYFTSVTIGTDALPVIAYLDYTNGDLKVLHCGNSACTSGNTATTVDSAGTVGYFPSITIGADGLPVIGYQDYSPNYNLKVLHCGNVACSSGNIATTVDIAGNVGYFSSITIGVDGLPVISYQDTVSSRLMVLHCSNAFCTPYFRRR